MKYEDPLLAMSRTETPVPAVQLPDNDPKFFECLLGTRHVDPEDGLQYETTKSKVTKTVVSWHIDVVYTGVSLTAPMTDRIMLLTYICTRFLSGYVIRFRW